MLAPLQTSVIDSGKITSPVVIGGNSLTDDNKNWGADIHKYRLAKITDGVAEGQIRVIIGNSSNSLVITPAWSENVPAGATYAIVGEDLGSVLAVITNSIGVLNPLEKGVVHNTAYVTGADIFGTAITPTNTPSLFRVYAGFDVSGILDARITRAGNTQTQRFNGGVPLNSDSLYAFSHIVFAGDTVNYRYSVNATIQTLKVVEIPSGI